MTAGTLDYLLGDVSNGSVVGTGNNRVAMEDISVLGANYGIGAATIASRGVEYIDVGPTVGGTLTGRPLPDGHVDFEDLFLFAGNFGSSAMAPPAAARRADPEKTAAEAFSLDAPSLVTAGETVTARLSLHAAGRIQGFSAQLGWDATVVEPVEVRSSGFVEGQGGVLLLPGPGAADAALLGLREVGMSGEGEVATVTLRALRTGDPAIGLAKLIARDASNQPIPLGEVSAASRLDPPAQTILLAPTPTPFRGRATLSFALARPGSAELTIYSIDGRRVRTLARGWHDAGLYHVAWNGESENRAPVAPGVYYVQLSAEGRRYTKKLVCLR
jgi:hypothetical protein